MGSLKDHEPHLVDLTQLAALAARVKEAKT
jgi:hypothetical protein